MASRGKKIAEKMDGLRDEYWPGEIPWKGSGSGESGWFSAPRTLPQILQIMRLPEVSGNQDPCMVYVELLARNMGEGIVRITNEDEHAIDAGYTGTRARRTWQERMKVLEDSGFIRTRKIGTGPKRTYKWVLLVHPTVAIRRLMDKGKVSSTGEWFESWETSYIERFKAVGLLSYEELTGAASLQVGADVVSIRRKAGA
jgi:hypothetical protein